MDDTKTNAANAAEAKMTEADIHKVNKAQSSYEHLMQGLKSQYPALRNLEDSSLFQFMATTKEASWTKRVDYSLYQMMDTVPSSRGGYYIPSDSKVTSTYETYMNTICEVNLNKNSKYLKLVKERDTKIGAMEALMNEDLKNAYIEDTGKNYTAEEFRKWLRNMCATDTFVPPAALPYINKKKEYDAVLKELDAQRKKLSKDYQQALADLEDEDQMMDLIVDGQPEPMKVPQMSLSGALALDVDGWESADKDMITIHINSEDHVEGMSHSDYKMGAAKMNWWFNASSQGEVTQELADEKYQLDIGIKGINTYGIQRGKWYKGQYVNPALDIEDGSIFKKDAFFGENGSLQLIPVSMLVIYKPSIKLTITSDVYERKIRHFLNATSVLSFFGMGFNAGAEMEKKLVEKGKVVEITFDSPTIAQPQVMGITSVKKYL